jgi:hypothetical protein
MHNIFAGLLGLEPVELYCALKLYGGLSDKDTKIETERVDELLGETVSDVSSVFFLTSN